MWFQSVTDEKYIIHQVRVPEKGKGTLRCFTTFDTFVSVVTGDPDGLPQWHPADANWGPCYSGNQSDWRCRILQRGRGGGVSPRGGMEWAWWVHPSTNYTLLYIYTCQLVKCKTVERLQNNQTKEWWQARTIKRGKMWSSERLRLCRW